MKSIYKQPWEITGWGMYACIYCDRRTVMTWVRKNIACHIVRLHNTSLKGKKK